MTKAQQNTTETTPEWCLECELFSAWLPLRAYNIEMLLRAGFSIGQQGYKAIPGQYLMVKFSRWIETADGKLGAPALPTLQITFTQYGVATTENLDTLFMPEESTSSNKPVLIYDYDSSSYLFCDVNHFISPEQAMHYVYSWFELAPPPIAQTCPDGQLQPVMTYMRGYANDEGELTDRPAFYNI